MIFQGKYFLLVQDLKKDLKYFGPTTKSVKKTKCDCLLIKPAE